MKKFILPLLCTLALTAGCETTQTSTSTRSSEPTYDQAAMSEFIRANYAAASALMQQYRPSPDSTNNFAEQHGTAPIIVATIANIDRLEQSSTLGRLMTEQLASRISQMGINVVEMKVRNSVFMRKGEGEFLLGREIKEVAQSHKAEAVVVGTYADGGDFIFVNLKLIDPRNSLILASHDYALPMNRQVRRLATGGSNR